MAKSKSITYNGITYPSIRAFAKAFETPALSWETIKDRIQNGYLPEKAIKNENLHSKPITYNGVTYPSIKAFAKAFETPTLSWQTIQKRLQDGYSPEEAIKDKHLNSKTIIYNGITYPSMQTFAKAFKTPTLSESTIKYRLNKEYSPEESILPYVKFNKNLQIDNHLKIINRTNNKSNYNVLINNKPEIWSIIMINKYLEKNKITL